jgi:hypothetical protein
MASGEAFLSWPGRTGDDRTLSQTSGTCITQHDWVTVQNLMTSSYQRFKPDYEAYLKRSIEE